MRTPIFKCASLALAFFSVYANNSYGQFSINETFKNNTLTNGITTGGSAHLTSGVSDPQGQGWLRLTDGTNNQAGYAVIQQAFPSAMGVLIEFEYTTWSNPGAGSGADGLSIFLFDAGHSDSFHVGGYGGSLGYSKRTDAPGLTGGYMGIGLDEFGNYSNPTEGRIGGPGFVKNVVALRGPAPEYAYLSGNQVIPSDVGNGDNGGIDYNTTTTTRPLSSQFYRRVQVSLEPHDGTYTVIVKWKKNQADSFSTLFGPVVMTAPPPAMLQLGLAASTGSQHNFHEVRNMVITTPGNISVLKQGPAYISNSPTAVSLDYDITVRNQTPVTVNDINIQDILPPGYTVDPTTGITIEQYGNAANTVSNISVDNGILTGLATLTSNSEITLHVNGFISNLQAGQSIRNTVKVSAASIQDMDTTNNADTVYTLVQEPLPVRLNYFTAQKQQDDISLNWETAMEINNDYYAIERSKDGKVFETIGTVKGKGNSTEASRYQFLDRQATTINAPALYYRLHQVDNDGKSDFSMIRSVSLHPGSASVMQVYPVPFSNKVHVLVNALTEGDVSLNLYNVVGQKVRQTEQKIGPGSNEVGMAQLENLPAGIYVLECILAGETNRLKILKQ